MSTTLLIRLHITRLHYAFGLGDKTNTVGNKIKTITSFLNRCVSRGIEVNPEFKKFKRLSENSVQVALSLEELEAIHQVTIPLDDRLSGIRDIFLLLCYTGLRYCDVVKLRPVNLKDDMLIVNTVKTSDNLKLSLMPQAREILERCPEIGLPDPGNKQANKLIRQLCELAGIDEPTLMIEHRGPTRIEKVVPKYELITTHTGRRTVNFPPRVYYRGNPVDALCRRERKMTQAADERKEFWANQQTTVKQPKSHLHMKAIV